MVIATVIATVVVIVGLAMTLGTYLVLAKIKSLKDSNDMDFKCPECGVSVNGTAMECSNCGAEFREGEYECPVCSSTVTADTKVCYVCGELFEDEWIFQCPHCGEHVPPDTIVCENCDQEFWSPVLQPDFAEVVPTAVSSEVLEEEATSS
jgi:DNA-directed RNA polymerase subunit RPC12/RpoP